MTVGVQQLGRFQFLRSVGAACALALVHPLPARAEPTACPAGHRVLFSCSTGAKAVQVCGSPDLSATGGGVQYRFGRPAAMELNLPAAGTEWRAATRGGTLMYSGGGGAYLAFANAPYRYVVYTAIGRRWEKSGVVVEKDGQRIASLNCRGKVVSELGPDLFSAAGVETSTEEFELP